ncbi:MAG TPA: calcium/sodium antiporter [Anaerolineae bacterium]|jgi:K+-dependent Na+/Ca+ exchanger-like protein
MGPAISSLIIMALAIFLLTIITDDFFIVSLDQISKKWRLPSNVAGASLMAAGSSAPELGIALFALFSRGGAHSDVGVGTIVGSAVFNILVITGVSAVFRPAKITWLVVVRDCVFYVVSIILLLVTFADGAITLIEAAAFLGMYIVYIVVLFQWETFIPAHLREVIDEPDPETPVYSPQGGIYHRITSFIARQLGFLMGNPETAYGRTFVVSILFIVGISWVLVESSVAFAEALGIPPIIVALTILAGGTSVPDMISSIIVARQGRGEMAVANAVGSNIFDILVGLGLPWILVLIVPGVDIVLVDSGNLWLSTLVLLGTVILLFVFLMTQRVLSKNEGWILIAVYVVYVLWTWLGGS